MIKSGENMIITNRIAKNNLHNYLNKNTKLGREVKEGKLIKIINGLYFAGEVIDVDAYTGGFNLQVAYSTGVTAGM